MPSMQKKSKAAKQAQVHSMRVAYATYLASDLWGAIRSKVLSKRPWCELCGDRATQVHHDSYHVSVMLGEMNDSLVSICRDCHEGIEFEGHQKLSSKEVRRKLRKWLIDTGRGHVTERLKEAQRKLTKMVKPKPEPKPSKATERRQIAAERARKSRRNSPSPVCNRVYWTTSTAKKALSGKRGPLAKRLKPTDS